MNDSTFPLHVGLADFAEPTLLIAGDLPSLRWFADCIASRQSCDLSTLAAVKLKNVGLTLEAADKGELSWDGEMLFWKISASESRDFSEQLRALAASKVPAHAYLDPASNGAGIAIVASNGEYGVDDVFLAQSKRP